MNNEQQNLLECVKALKAEWGAGSADALNYVRANREYESLRGEVAAKLSPQCVKPTLREVSNAADCFSKCLNKLLDWSTECIVR
ncbi:MAG TPA: hypothetical protein VJJ82_02490 [Candidatus Nanoarchaeia archaeon]|nr:hypothetical protein [Candidatus Nanoarchaeia archaeon]